MGNVFMKVTIKDIAQASGYSVATVSMALSEKENHVSPTTKEKVRTIARSMNYYPNRVAVSLVTQKSKTIGMMTPDLTNTHVSTFFTAVGSTLQKSGYSLLCHTIHDLNDYSVKTLSDMVASGVDGIILSQPYVFSTAPAEMDKMRNYLKGTGLPLVSRDIPELNEHGVDVHFNYFQGAYLATRHLLECGHTRIGCVTGSSLLRVTGNRTDGYRHALEEAGIPFDEKLLFRGDYSMESGSQALSYLLGQKVTAIFSFNDEMAFGLYRSARQYRVKIPADISVVGFDNVPFADVLDVPLTTIHIPTYEIGCRVAEVLIDMIENGVPDHLLVENYEPTLMIRGSTAHVR
jgi:LacI family transcriptional regulator